MLKSHRRGGRERIGAAPRSWSWVAKGIGDVLKAVSIAGRQASIVLVASFRGDLIVVVADGKMSEELGAVGAR